MKKFMFFLLLLIPINIYAISDTSSSSILMDTDSGRILYQKNANEERLIASITKIMTAVITIENSNLNDEVEVGEEVLTMYGSNIYLEKGEKMTVINLLYGLLLRSGNDAAVVLANYVGKDEKIFVSMMNKKAKEIGMKNTLYNNSHGLDEQTKNHSTAYDMAMLSSYAIKIPIYKKIVSTKKWTVSNGTKTYLWNNRNKLLSLYEYAIGGKTGYTPSAGRTLVTNASKDSFDLTAVTLNDGDEYTTHISLYEYAFDKYKKYLIIDKDDFKIDDNYFDDELYVKNSFYYPLSEQEKDKIKVLIKLQKKANYRNNENMGKIIVYLNNKEIYNDIVYVKNKVEDNSFFSKIKKFFIGIFK